MTNDGSPYILGQKQQENKATALLSDYLEKGEK